MSAIAAAGVRDEGVLEVGTGHGFQTALLAELSGFVWSVERGADLAATARENLAGQGTRNAEVVVGDGTLGLARRVIGARFVPLVGRHGLPEDAEH